MLLSVICPAYNEINFIDSLVSRLCADDGIDKEILIADGGSLDGTREKIAALMKTFPNLRLVENPLRTSTHGFNLAYNQSSGRYIAFVGAHADYAKDYFNQALNYLERNECDVVGGPLQQKGKTKMGNAIALVMSSKLGVGNTEFRTMNKKMFVDSVAFAVYRREVFEKSGLMDESLPVNQDDEFHYRIVKNGYKILMVPEIKAVYYVRDSLGELSRQYFRYGLYKPLVLRKVKSSVRLRHVIPSLFTMYILALFTAFYFPAIIIPLVIYILLIVIAVFNFKSDVESKLLSVLVFPVLHLSYGSGFLIGLFKKTK